MTKLALLLFTALLFAGSAVAQTQKPPGYFCKKITTEAECLANAADCKWDGTTCQPIVAGQNRGKKDPYPEAIAALANCQTIKTKDACLARSDCKWNEFVTACRPLSPGQRDKN